MLTIETFSSSIFSRAGVARPHFVVVRDGKEIVSAMFRNREDAEKRRIAMLEEETLEEMIRAELAR